MTPPPKTLLPKAKATAGLFEYPAKAVFGRVLPKTKVFTFGKVSRRLKDAFARDIAQIVWQYKLAPETVNLSAGIGVAEIQVFSIELKADVPDMSEDLLRCIDAAISFPIIFEVVATMPKGKHLKVITAYKRPSEADSSKWVVGEYFATGWLHADTVRSQLPVALNLASLYEQVLRSLMPVAGRPGESLADLAERYRLAAVKQRELSRLEQQLAREKQFNRKVEINAEVRAVKTEVEELVSTKAE